MKGQVRGNEMEISQENCREEEKNEGKVYLKRKITLLRAISLTICTIIGSGIFISPKGVLKNSGNIGLSLIVWLACGVLSMFGALCYADLGTTFKKSGGHYTYILETLGPLPAFLRVWAEFILIRPASTAVVSLAFGRYVIEPFFAPCHAPILAVKLITAVGVWAASQSIINLLSPFGLSRMQISLDLAPMETVQPELPGEVVKASNRTNTV
ncbi:cystine/glutamate transporter-like [Pleurodeles waltl]|uniref:cystine/glutamate transporter-like n=1 Tax=Pleurodeles waltl TaxID=8319 RepID=UPI003709712E